MRNSTPPARPRASGFTLTEVIVALGLFVFAITGLMGVIPAGMSQVQTASNESRALAEMESIRDDVRLAIGSRMKSSLRYRITPPAAATTVPVDYQISEDGEVVTGNGPALYRVIGTIRAPAAGSADPVYLHLRATWPAKAPAGKESGSVELISAFKS
jgi:type II secretory pathway pseudopilin PulG